MSNAKRIGKDGKPAEDVIVNPLAVERKAREAVERVRATDEAAEPWTRAKIERELRRAKAREQIVVDGKEVPPSLNLHGATIPDGTDLSGIDLSNCNMHGLRAKGVKFDHCILTRANMHGAVLDGCSFQDVEADELNLCESCCCGSKFKFRRREPEPGKDPVHISRRMNMSDCCMERTEGIDIQEKPLTDAEHKKARHHQSEGFRVAVSVDEGKVRYYGPELTDANLTGMSRVCRKRSGKKPS